MKRHVVVNPDPYDHNKVASYYREARLRFWEALHAENARRRAATSPSEGQIGYPYIRHPWVQKLASDLYLEYKNARKIIVSYDEFQRELLGPWRWYRRCPWYGRNEPSKYQKAPHHAKKELDEKEQSRRAWREHKKFSKDKGKMGHGNWHGSKARKPCRKMEEKQFRQRNRMAIKHERYDDMGAGDHIQDKWLWD